MVSNHNAGIDQVIMKANSYTSLGRPDALPVEVQAFFLAWIIARCYNFVDEIAKWI